MRLAPYLLVLAPFSAQAQLNISSAAVCSKATDVCTCSELAPGCGWCSSSKTCEPADQCTTTCRECPHTHKTCRKSCRRKCINTCALVSSVCGCTELEGCGWCSHGLPGATPHISSAITGKPVGSCQPYPECSTTCEECDPKCHTYKHCQSSCYARFRAPQILMREADKQEGLWPLRQKDIWCATGIFAATVLASAAGIGGGAVLVPVFTLLGEFTEHEAIPLSIATVFGASTYSALGTYIWQKHPMVGHRHMVAYDVVLVLLPATLLGSTGGVFLNKVCPNWLIMVLLVLLCAYSGNRTLSKARQMWAKESREQDSGSYAPVKQAAEELKAVSGGSEIDTSSSSSQVQTDAAALRKEREDEATFPWGTLLLLIRCWVLVMILSMLKGGHGAPSLVGATCGSLGYWGLVALNVPVLGFLTKLAGRGLLRRHQRLMIMGYEYAEGDVAWDSDKVSRYPAIVMVGAISAGMLGVGGGMVLGPIFLELGILPQVSSATSTVMVMFMSSCNVGQFVVLGMLDMEYACYYGSVGIVGAIIGTGIAGKLVKATGRASFLVFFLAFILLGSGVLMAATGTPQLIRTGLTGFRPVCGRAGAAAKVD